MANASKDTMFPEAQVRLLSHIEQAKSLLKLPKRL